MKSFFVGLTSVVFLASPTSASALEIFKQTSASYDFQKLKRKKIKFPKKGKEVRQLFDVQYNKKIFVQGFDIAKVIGPHAQGMDTLLLNFANGMSVPVPINSLSTEPVFLATGLAKSKKGPFKASFPSIAKFDEMIRDPRPITFSTNKIVYSSKTYIPSQSLFIPFKYTDSLQEIEIINGPSREKALAFRAKPSVEKGHAIYMKRCQYCHGVDDRGAKFGRDFVDPIPMYTMKTPENLLTHVKYKKIDGIERGLLMPAQTNLTASEAKYIWEWMKAAAAK